MTQMLKQFGRDHSLQRENLKDLSQPFSSLSSLRSRKQKQCNESMINEFFGQSSQNDPQIRNGIQVDNNFGYSKLQHQLNFARQTNQTGDWANEFKSECQINPNLEELTPSEGESMKKAFMENKIATDPSRNAAAWREEFMHHPEVINMDQSQLTRFESTFQKNGNWANEFDRHAKRGESMLFSNNATWVEQFSEFDNNGDIGEFEFQTTETNIGDSITNDNGNVSQNSPNQSIEDNSWGDEFGSFNDPGIFYKPNLGEYVFEVSNPFLSHPDPFSEGLRLLEGGCSLTDAALAFEAAVQLDPEDSQAWMNLGNSHAQNEKEIPAIRALERAVAIDSENLDALMSLSVSYTNESYDQAAYLTLERWIIGKYPSILKGQPFPEKVSPFELQMRTINFFLTIARQAPDAESMDPDVQVGLGVLFYGSGDLDKAADCFISALKSRPNDYLLWNRMGATLANQGRGEEAIDAYHKALEIRPSFVRARYNIGVSCINIGCYKEAAECILQVISMHKRNLPSNDEGINVSNKAWGMLRKALIRMGRHDLADKAIAGVDLNQFRSEFDF
ncbi:TPR-like protein [Backusella circina FSU 941]|nr:TPR-like protein [Backusella circina FSU 941]